jgi:hypothetical protein
MKIEEIISKIDSAKLSRDFQTSPLKRGETPTTTELAYLQGELKLTLKDIGLYFHKQPQQVVGWKKRLAKAATPAAPTTPAQA